MSTRRPSPVVLEALLRPFAGRRTGKPLPTAEFYFAGPLRDLIGPGNRIEPLGGTAFIANNRGVLIRYASKRELAILKNRNLERLYYVIDDDLFAAASDPFLPLDYRDKLARFARDAIPYILDIADEIVAPSPAILGAPSYGRLDKTLLDPASIGLCPDLSHFESPPDIRCVMLGTRSHRADIASVALAVVSALEKAPKLSVTTFLGHHAPPEFGNHPRIHNRAPLPWPAFRQVLLTERFHIALAPALPTGFNKARSITRILDHAAFGAAGIYANQPPFTGRITGGQDGLLLDAGPQSWSEALIALANDLRQAQNIAAGGRRLAERLGNPARVRQFWHERQQF